MASGLMHGLPNRAPNVYIYIVTGKPLGFCAGHFLSVGASVQMLAGVGRSGLPECWPEVRLGQAVGLRTRNVWDSEISRVR